MLRYVWIEGWQQIFRIFILYDKENRKKKKMSIKPGYTERRNFSLQLGSSNCNQHALSKLSHKLYQLKCQHFRVVVAILDVISWRHPYYVSLIR